MSVVGFDIGNFKSSVGIARAGGIDIVANEYSDRITPTYVTFSKNERFQGHSSKQLEIAHHQNTICNFKRLLARKMHESQVQNELNFQPLRMTPGSDDKILFNVDYLNESRTYTPEQIMGTFLTKLKTIAEMNLNTKVVDCVISCPSFMTDAERRALIDASQISGLNCLKLMNETTAVALSYGLYNANLPEVTEKPHIVAFVDMGATAMQASIVAFHKGKLRMMATTYDCNLGGRDFDRVIMDHFQKEFKTRFGVDAYTNTRARLRLRAEAEKLKKLMSSNSSPLPLNIECFMNDVDVSGKMKREEFEEMSKELLVRVRNVLNQLLQESKIALEDISLIEIVGGSTRIPAVKQIIADVFKKEPSTTLNADEACARGCTLMCAILSPTFKVKEFKIEECQLFPITLTWKGAETDDNELEVFPLFDKVPMSKLLTIYKKEAFEIEARYRFPNNIPFGDARIGKFYIGNVTPNAAGDNSEVKLKARITKNGVFEISTPQIIEVVEIISATAEQKQSGEPAGSQEQKTENGDEEQKIADNENDNEDSQTGADEQTPTNTNGAAESNGDAAPATHTATPAPAQKKRKTKAIDLPLTAKVPQMSKTEINFFIEQELSMIAQDRKEKERSEAKNSVEEYIYDARSRLSSEQEKFLKEEAKQAFLALLDDTENWLYSDEADNQEKSVYVDRLTNLKIYGEPMRVRYKESQERPHLFEQLGKSLQLIKKALNQYYTGDEKYQHLDKADIEKVAKSVEEKEKWFQENSYLVAKMKLNEDPVLWCTQIKAEKEILDKSAWSVLNKPKPKVDPPKPKEEPAAPEPQSADTTKANGKEAEEQAQQNAKNMDVD